MLPKLWKLIRSELGVYAAAFGLCLLILIGTLRLWRADWHVPLAYSGDSLFTQLWIKGIIEHGWYLHNDNLGTPYGCDLHDFPMADSLNFLILKGLAWMRRDTAFVYNAYYLLTFPLVTLASLAVLRRFAIAAAPAVIVSLLYTFLPYHFLRGMAGHLFLAGYCLVPFAVLVALRLGPRQTIGRRFTWKQLAIVLLLCLALASSGIYYAFFACFLFLIAGLHGAFTEASARPLGWAFLFCGVVLLGTLANAYPTLAYQHHHGPNPNAVQRLMAGPEIYGLKIMQLFLPPSFHRIAWLAAKKTQYNLELPIGSGDFWYLGIVGSSGFLVLIGHLLTGNARPGQPSLLPSLSILNLFAVLFATTAGFGALFSFLVSSWVRAYERMSIYIAFFSFFACALLLTRLTARSGAGLPRRIFAGVLLVVVFVVGLEDLTSRQLVPPYHYLRDQYTSDAQFVRAIEASVPPNAQIFQLPYVPFPENPPVFLMQDYDHLRGYLHSQALRWSYGAVKGREGDQWLKTVANLGLPELLRQLGREGFQGIYVDRLGYADGGVALQSELTRLTGAEPLVSANQRLVFFLLRDASNRGRTNGLARGH
jgi:phosphoglycerol transferase